MTLDDRLVAVQDAAVERALSDDDSVRDHLELVGALEVARDNASEGVGDETFATAMACLVAVAALPRCDRPQRPVSPPTPGESEPFLAAGVDVAVERFDADRERLARLAGVPLGRVR